MSLQIIQMFAQVVATQTDFAQIDIPEDGKIVGVDWSIFPAGGAGAFGNDDSMAIELSFLSSASFAQNDARGLISVVALAVGNQLTSGMAFASVQKYVSLAAGLDVNAGERLHLHSLEFGVANSEVNCLIHLDLRRAPPRRTRRRR